MNNKLFKLLIGILMVFELVACQSRVSSKSGEATCIPQTIEVTRIVPQPTFRQESGTIIVATKTAVSSPSITVQVGSASVQMDPSYFDGFIILTQYYTLLDHGLYEEVLPLYSSSLLKKSGGKNFEADLKSVEIRFIHPYNFWRAQQKLPPQPIPENDLRFIVGTIVFHKSPAWNVGSTPKPDSQTRFVSLVLESGAWKINEFNSSPWFQ